MHAQKHSRQKYNNASKIQKYYVSINFGKKKKPVKPQYIAETTQTNSHCQISQTVGAMSVRSRFKFAQEVILTEGTKTELRRFERPAKHY